MTYLQGLILRCSKSPLAFLAVFLGFNLSFFALFRIAEAFAGATGGLQPFDMQNELTVEEVLAQLPHYTEASRRLYALFTVTDYVFPVLGGLFVASVGAFLLRHGLPSAYAWLEARRGLVVFLLPTLFDWLENVAALPVVFGAAPPSQSLATLLIVCKKLKLGSLFLSWTAIALLALVALGRKLWSLLPTRAQM
jgi:hypothetical protein